MYIGGTGVNKGVHRGVIGVNKGVLRGVTGVNKGVLTRCLQQCVHGKSITHRWDRQAGEEE